MAATVSAGWGSSGGGYGSSGGYSAGLGSSGGYSTGYGSSGGNSGSYGSSGGSYSSGYGSSGGYSAGYGSSGGVAHVGPLRRIAASIHSHHAARRASYSVGYGSSGGGSSGGSYSNFSFGSSGGGYSSASYGSSGGHGSQGSYGAVHHGSSGGGSTGGYSHASYGSTGGSYHSGSHYSAPIESHGSVGSGYDSGVIYQSSPSNYAPAMDGTPMISPMTGTSLKPDSNNYFVSSSKSSIAPDEIHLNVQLPESASVFVNGNRTTSKGALRNFVSKNLAVGSSYRFEVRAEREVNGEVVTENKTVVLTPGSTESIEFQLAEKSKVSETVLTLNVPNDAKVVLAGNGTKTVGSSRTFRTQELTPGQVWDDYKIIVTWNGQVKERTIRLIGGDEMEISFNFDDSNKIALR